MPVDVVGSPEFRGVPLNRVVTDVTGLRSSMLFDEVVPDITCFVVGWKTCRAACASFAAVKSKVSWKRLLYAGISCFW